MNIYIYIILVKITQIMCLKLYLTRMQTNSVVMMQEAKPPSDSCITAGNDRNSWFSLILNTTPKTLLQCWIWACLTGGLFNTSGIRSLSFLHPASRSTPLWHRLRLPAPQDSLGRDPAAWDRSHRHAAVASQLSLQPSQRVMASAKHRNIGALSHRLSFR